MPTLGYLSAAPRVSTKAEAMAGPRAHVLGVIKGFQEEGWQVRPFIVGDRMPQTVQSEKSESLIRGGRIRPLLTDLLRVVMGFVNSRRAWKELKNDIDWVYERHATLQSLGWIFKRNHIPWILETNAPLFIEATKDRNTSVLKRLVQRIEFRAYRDCDILVCVSETLKEIILQSTMINPQKIIVLPNGVDTSFFDPEKYTPIKIFDGFTICYVGELSYWQGLDLLLSAAANLRHTGSIINILIVGDGTERVALETKATKLGLVDQVKFVGQIGRDEVPKYIAGCDLGYMGKRALKVGSMYHSPLKLFEYMSMAKPVVASYYEGINEVVIEGVNGYIFQPESLESLSRSLAAAFTNYQQLHKMGQNARQHIVENHDWSNRVNMLISSVECVLAGTP